MRAMNKIEVMMNDETKNELIKLSSEMDEWHCIKGFLDECVIQTERKKEIHKNTDYADIPLEFATFAVEITPQQVSYLRSDDAKKLFEKNDLTKEFLRQLVEYRITKIKKRPEP